MIHWLMEKLGLDRCPECNTLVDFAMDGLEDGQRGRVRKHLSECPPCMEQVRDFVQVNEGLGLMAPLVDCPDGFEKRVLQRLKQEGTPVPGLQQVRPQTLGAWPVFWLRVGPVFALLSVVMSLVALGALMHGPAVSGNELSELTDSLLKDPQAQHVALAGAGGSGELVLCKGLKNIYFKGSQLAACAKGGSYVLWMQPAKAAPIRLAAFIAEGDGPQVQLLQLSHGLEGSGPVQFTLTEEGQGAKPGSKPALSGSVSL